MNEIKFTLTHFIIYKFSKCPNKTQKQSEVTFYLRYSYMKKYDFEDGLF